MTEAEILLKVEDLSVVFPGESGPVYAVEGVSFELRKGETLGIVGESGSGKSMTALSLMQLLPATGHMESGSIRFSGEENKIVDLARHDDREMRKYRGRDIGMIFQEPMSSLNPVFRCGAQVDEVTRIHLKYGKEEARAHTLELFRKVQLPDPERIYHAFPHQLSGGQKQRVMIAMALAAGPRILIADEPTTALDVTVQKAILDLMAELREETGAAVIFITHDLGVVAEIADRVLVMYRGRIVEQGSVKEIFTHPKHPYTRGLLACRPPLDKRLRRLPTVEDFLNEAAEEPGRNHLKSMLSRVEVSREESRKRLKALMEEEPLLRVEGLKTWFPRKKSLFGKVLSWVKAVDDVSLDVFPGETLGLVGESGSGKTSFGRSILRLQNPTGGRVWYGEKNLFELTEQEMRKMRTRMQIVFQDPYSSLNPRMTIGQAISEPMAVHHILNDRKERKERTIELLERVGMKAEHFDRYPHEFSGGQRQRICIARALSVNPEFIVCDESVSALDVSVQAQVLNLLLELREEFGLTYIFISHDLSVVRFMSDRIAVMKDGRIVEAGPADELYENPKADYTRELISAIPKVRI